MFVHVQLLGCAHLIETLETIAHQAPLSIGLSWQEYWSRLPFPPPGDLPNSGIEPASPTSPTLAGRVFTTEPCRKPKNTGVGSLSLFQGIFLTQESNQGLLHCKQILYQLNYQGSPAAAAKSLQ